VRIPFHRELDDLFQSDHAIWLKMGGCALATIFIVITTTWRGVRTGQLPISLSAPLVAALTVASAVIGALLALALSLKDVVQRRINREEPVSPILRLYFGSGVQSLAVWFLTVLIGGFFITIATLR
jgi:hypothetical protein